MTIKDFLDSKNIKYSIKERPNTGIQYILSQCPACGEKDCFAIGENGLYNCFRQNNCGVSGNFESFQLLYGNSNYRLDAPKKNFINKASKKEYRIPKIPMLKLSDDNYHYLTEKRALNASCIEFFSLFNGVMGEICFPYYKNGQLVNVKHYIPVKDDDKKKFWNEKECELCLFNQDSVEGDDYLIICEGQIDCVSLVQYGLKNSVSVPNGCSNLNWIDNDYEFLDRFKEIYLCLDNDKAGQKNIDRIVARLGNWRVKNITLPHKDANECLKSGVTKEEILKCFEEAEEFGPAEIKTADNFCLEVLDMFRNPDKYMGYKTGFDELDNCIKGWRKGEVTLWSGQNGSGKTTILNQSCLYMGKSGIKSCIASLELKPKRYLKWAVQQYTGTSYPKEDDIIKAFSWLGEWFYVVDIDDDVSMDKIFDVFEYSARRFGVEIFVIDSLMKVDLNCSNDKEEQKSQKKFINKLVQFAKKFQVHVHIVAHPRKQESDTDIPTKADVKGAGEITDLVDNVIIIWRVPDVKKVKENNADAMLFVRKNREFGTLASIPMYFEMSSRRYTCIN